MGIFVTLLLFGLSSSSSLLYSCAGCFRCRVCACLYLMLLMNAMGFGPSTSIRFSGPTIKPYLWSFLSYSLFARSLTRSLLLAVLSLNVFSTFFKFFRTNNCPFKDSFCHIKYNLFSPSSAISFAIKFKYVWTFLALSLSSLAVYWIILREHSRKLANQNTKLNRFVIVSSSVAHTCLYPVGAFWFPLNCYSKNFGFCFCFIARKLITLSYFDWFE